MYSKAEEGNFSWNVPRYVSCQEKLPCVTPPEMGMSSNDYMATLQQFFFCMLQEKSSYRECYLGNVSWHLSRNGATKLQDNLQKNYPVKQATEMGEDVTLGTLCRCPFTNVVQEINLRLKKTLIKKLFSSCRVNQKKTTNKSFPFKRKSPP